MWALLLLGIPIYVFSSGLPQPADMGLALFLGIAALTCQRYVLSDERRVAVLLVQYVVWVAVVNLTWSLLVGYEPMFFFSTAFAIFNAVVLIGFLAFGSRSPAQVLRVTGRATAIALMALGVLAVLRPGMTNGTRLVLFFNNPNQLAYYALGALTVVMLAHRGNPLSRVLLFGAIAAAGFLIFRTYSRAALGAYAVLCAVPFVRRPVYILLACLPLLVIAVQSEEAISSDPLWQRRVSEAGSQEFGDYMEDRGVDRLVRNPEYLLFGAGEGKYLRFHPLGLELHSSLASILFCYGLIGLILIGRVAIAIARRVPVDVAMYLLPSVIYSLFHNGMRFRIFWLSISVAALLPRVLASPREQTESEPPLPAAEPSASSPIRCV